MPGLSCLSLYKQLPERGPVGGQGSMGRAEFREALTTVWCFSVLAPETQAFWLWGGRE